MNDNDHASGPTQGQPANPPVQPGETIAPQSAPMPQPSQASPAPADPEEQHFFRVSDNAPAPTPAPAPVQPVQQQERPGDVDVRMEDSSYGVTWTASEFIAHQKAPEWYMAVGIVTVAVAVVTWFIAHDIFSEAVVIIVGILFGVAASRSPRLMQYGVDDHGVSIGRSFYPYSTFRSFTVATEGPFRSIVFMPLKRFMPPISIYFDPQDEGRIGDILAEHLPMHEHREAATDRLMRRIRF